MDQTVVHSVIVPVARTSLKVEAPEAGRVSVRVVCWYELTIP